MEVTGKARSIWIGLNKVVTVGKEAFFKRSRFSRKVEPNFRTIKTLSLIGILLFISIVFMLPDETPIEFSEKKDQAEEAATQISSRANVGTRASGSARDLWAAPKPSLPAGSSGSEVNHNTSMIIGQKYGNAKTEFRAGIRLPLRILDKVIVSQASVPILAELLVDSQTDSGLSLPAGTKFYGEASFQKGTDRAQIRFSQMSLPNGRIRSVSALALGKDGQPGILGRIFSDGVRNTAGQVLTTFVGGLAAGSMQTDIFGRSKGGIENGLLGAVAATAQSRAQVYGEKLKTEREWIELQNGSECDAVLNSSLKLQEGGDGYE